MTSPLAVAHVLIEGKVDIPRFVANLERDLGVGIRSVHLNLAPIGKQLDDGLKKGVAGAVGAFEKIDDASRNAFKEVAHDSDVAFDTIRHDATEAGKEVGVELQRGGERAEDALQEVGRRAKTEFDNVDRHAAASGAHLGAVFRRAAGVLAAAFATVRIAQFFATATTAAEDLGSAVANTQQIIKSTGGAAKLLATDIRTISQQLSLKIGVDSVEVQNAANVLLTFKGVTGTTFKTAIGLAADLSSVLGSDLKGAALQLGKALNDPVLGVGALSRAGVQFNTTQKAQIKNFVATNQLAKAQAIILKEVTSQVGGVAEAGADTTDKLKVAFLDLKREAGQALIGFIDDHGPQLISLIQKMEPVVSKFGGLLAGALEAVLPIVDVVVTSLRTNFAAVAPALAPFAEILRAVLSLLPGVIPPLVQITQAILPPLAAIVGAVATALTPVLSLFVQLAAQIVTSLLPALGPIGDLLAQVATVVGGALLQVMPPLADAVLKLVVALLPLVPLAVDLLTAVLPLVPALAGIVAVLAPLAGALAGPLGALAGFLADNVPLVLTLAGTLAAFAIAANASAIAVAALMVVGNIWAVVTKVWTAAQWLLNIALDANPVGIVILAIGALVTVIVLAWQHSEEFRKAVVAVWGAIKVAAAAIGGAFVTAWHAVSDFFIGLSDWFAALPGRIGGFLTSLPTLLFDLLGRMFNQALVGIGVGIGLVLAAIIILPRLILGAIIALPGMLLTFFTGVWESVKAATIAGVTAVVAFVVALPGRIGSAIAALPGILRGAFVAALAAARDAAVSGFNGIVSFIASVPGRIVALGGQMFSAGKALIGGFMNGLKSVGNFIGDVAGSIVGAIKGFLNNVIGKINSGIGSIDDKLPISLPRIPSLATGGLTQRAGLAALHPRELVLPLEDVRAVDLLGKALAEAQAGLRATGVMSGDGGPIHIAVYLGTREITDIVDVQVSESNRSLKRAVTAGRN